VPFAPAVNLRRPRDVRLPEMRTSDRLVRTAARLAAAAVLLVALGACEFAPATIAPLTPPPPTAAARPGIQIDETWQVQDGEWTFTGRVDPEGDATDVVLEIGPGPATARRFDARVEVLNGVVDAAPLRITTSEIPDIDEICVRFTATNGVGASSSRPLCFPHDLPSFVAEAPTVTIDEDYTVTGREYAFTGRIDPNGVATDVVLELGSGPAADPTFDQQLPAGAAMTEPATITLSTGIPDADEVCVRFTATNDVGTASSTPLCFAPGS
jgi:hypothetical protein